MLQRQRLHERCQIHSIHFSFTRGKICTQATSLQSLIPKEKSLYTWPPDFDACEVDLDMQMSFLNAAPFLTKCSLTCLSIRRGGIPRVLVISTIRHYLSIVATRTLISCLCPLENQRLYLMSRWDPPDITASLLDKLADLPAPQKNNNKKTHTQTNKKVIVLSFILQSLTMSHFSFTLLWPHIVYSERGKKTRQKE